jgi:hypothetical protein
MKYFKNIYKSNGRFDDSFNLCIGDVPVFRSSNYSYRSRTFSYDYEREETRKYVFMALFSSFNVLSENVIVSGINKYLNIPQNKVVL